MARRSEKKQTSQVKLQDYVVVTVVQDYDLARDLETLLRTNEIDAMVKEDSSESSDKYSILVPEEHIDEAHVVVESQDAYDDFYDCAMEDEDDFDSDYYLDEY